MRCRFFQVAPAGQDHFKQSTTRLYFIANKIIEMTMEMYREPRAMVQADSAVAWASATKYDSISSNAIFDNSKLHLTCRQQNVTRLSNKQLQSENIFPDKFQICGVGTTWPRHHEILFEVGRSSKPEICSLKLPDFASEPPKILAIHAFSCSNDLLWPWLLAMSLWVSDWCLA